MNLICEKCYYSACISEAVSKGEIEQAVFRIIPHANEEGKVIVVLMLLFTFGAPVKVWALLNAIHSKEFSY